jgi:hypothetical protein
MATFLKCLAARTCLTVAIILLNAAELVRRWTTRLLWNRRINVVDARLVLSIAKHLNRAAIRLIRITPCPRGHDEF